MQCHTVACTDKGCVVTTAIAAVVCSLVFFLVGAIVGGLSGHWTTIYRQRKGDSQLPPEIPLYEDLPENPMSTENSHIETMKNEAYGQICTQNL